MARKKKLTSVEQSGGDPSPENVAKKRGRPKKVNTKPKSKQKKYKKKPGRKRKSGTITTYAIFQRYLSKYCKKENINPGKNFNKIASELWERLDEQERNIDYIEKNYYKLFRKLFQKGVKKFEDFAWFEYQEVFKKEVFNDINIIVNFKHPYTREEVNLEGSKIEIINEFRSSGLYAILRRDYSGSGNIAYLKVHNTDGDSYVNYVVMLDKDASNLKDDGLMAGGKKLKGEEQPELIKPSPKPEPIPEPKPEIKPELKEEKPKSEKVGELDREEFEKLTSHDLKEIIKAREERQAAKELRDFKVSELKKAVDEGVITKKEYLEFLMKL